MLKKFIDINLTPAEEKKSEKIRKNPKKTKNGLLLLTFGDWTFIQLDSTFGYSFAEKVVLHNSDKAYCVICLAFSVSLKMFNLSSSELILIRSSKCSTIFFRISATFSKYKLKNRFILNSVQ